MWFRALIKSMLVLGAIMALCYATSPWWLSLAIKNYTPASVEIKHLDLQYPSMRSMTVRHLALQSGNIALKAAGFSFDYATQRATISKLDVSVLRSDDKHVGSLKDVLELIFSLPNGVARVLPQVDAVKSVSVAELTIKNGQQLSTLVQVDIEPRPERIRVDIAMLKNEQLQQLLAADKVSPLENIALNLINTPQGDDQPLSLEMFMAKQLLARIQAIETSDQDILTFTVHSPSLLRILADFGVSSIAVPSDYIALRFIKTIAENSYAIFLETDVQLDMPRLLHALDNKPRSTKDKPPFVDAKVTWQARLRPSISGGADQYTGDFTLGIDLHESLQLNHGNSKGVINKGSISLQSPFQFLFPSKQKPKLVVDYIRLNAQAASADFLQQVQAHSTAKAFMAHPRLTATLQLDSPLVFDLNTAAGLNSAVWQIDGELQASKAAYSMGIDEESDALLDMSTPIEMVFSIENNDTLLSNGKLLFPSLVVKQDNVTAQADMNIVWRAVDVGLTQGSAHINMASAQHDILGYSFDSLASAITLALTDNEIAGAATFTINDEVIAPATFVFDRETNATLINLAEQGINIGIVNAILKQLGDEKKLPLSVVDGKINHNARMAVGSATDFYSRLLADNVQFRFGENTVSGLKLSQEIASVNKNTYEAILSVDNIAFSSGLDVAKVYAQVLANTNSDMSVDIALHNVQAQLLEGQLSATEMQIQQGELKRSLLSLNKVSLTELVFFLEVSGLFAEGQLDIELPTSTHGGQLVVDNGQFQSVGTGVIKYSTGSPVDDENIALQALRNFHYQSLDGTISYNERGEYLIKIHLLGSNPDLYNGYPIDFVLNLNGELSGVFRSLFLTGDFKEAVMQQLKTEQGAL